MTPERWREIERLYQAAVERNPEEQQNFLATACGSDKDLREQVALLLAQRDSTRDLFRLISLESVMDERETAAVLDIGARLGPYQIAGVLGEGGMGKVYRALDTRLNRAVAVKISAEPFSKRFEREARAISALNHPNICTLYDVGLLPSGAAFMVTELVEGETLRSWLTHSPGLQHRLAIIRQVIQAVQAAHEAGIVHRDLKPANIMVRPDGYAKVLDFGLAKRIRGNGTGAPATATFAVTGAGQIVGTVGYMSPEQILGQEVDARGDVFALGVILYEMMAGHHPWPRKLAVETMHAILHDDPQPIGMPGTPIDGIVRRCLAKEPTQRFQTMSELGAAVQSIPAEYASNRDPIRSSIAVLPFANMSADKENEYFGDGLAEEIIHALAQVPTILVAGRTSSFFFRDKDVELREIGQRLNVEYILEGSVRKAGKYIRVTAQLIKVTDGFHLWSERYDREVTDIFVIQDEITSAIARALRIRLSPETPAPRRHTPDLRAYEAFLAGRQHLLVRRSPDSPARGKALLERAIELDSEFALPRSLLGAYYTTQAGSGMMPARQAIQSARAAEEGALGVDPSLPEAHAMLGVCAGMDYNWIEAEGHWRSAMAREPVPLDVLFWYGNHYLLPQGRAPEAVEVEAKVLETDPLNLLYRRLHATALDHAGRWTDAEMEFRRVLELEESSKVLAGLALVYAKQERFEQALALTERAYSWEPQSTVLTGQLAGLRVRAGAAGQAVTLIEKLRAVDSPGVSVGMALFHALCREFDQAAEWTERAIEERFPLLVAMLAPLLRPSSQWSALARMMNLPR